MQDNIIMIAPEELPEAAEDHAEQAFIKRFHGVSGRLDGVYDCLQGVSGLSAERLQSVLGTFRTGRNTRIHVQKHPIQRYGAWAAGGAVVAALSSTLRHGEPRAQLFWYLTAAGLVLACDIFDLSGRLLAPQSRALITTVLALINIAVFCNDDTFSGMVALIGAAAFYLIRKQNIFWMDSYNWKMTPEVQQALNSTPDSRAYQTWIERGRRESKTLARSRGHEVTEEITDGLFRDFYILGFCNAYQVTQNAEQNKKDLEIYRNGYQTEKARADEAEEELEKLREQKEEATEDIRSKDLYIRSLKRDIKQLQAANEDLLTREHETPEEPQQDTADTTEPDKTLEERIIECLAQGMGVRETARTLGTSPATVSKLKNAKKQPEEAQENTEPEALEATA